EDDSLHGDGRVALLFLSQYLFTTWYRSHQFKIGVGDVARRGDARMKLHNINFKILKNISLEIPQGDFLLLLGGNGSGKSTLLQVLANQKPQSTVMLTQDPRESLFFDMTVWENILLYKLRVKNKDEAREYLATFNPNLRDKL